MKNQKILGVGLMFIAVGLFAVAGVWFYSIKKESKEQVPLVEVPTPSEAIEAAESVWENEIVGSLGEVENVESTPNLEEVIRLYNMQTLTYHYNSICHI